MNDPADLMRQLDAGVRAARPAEPPPSDELLRALSEAYEGAVAAWPTVKLEAREFATAVAARIDGSASADAVRKLVAADLYLACACAAGEPNALAAFDTRYLHRVPAYVSHIGVSASAVDELTQVLRDRLLVSVGGEPPRIAQYGGRGSLEAWVRVAAIRAMLNLIEKERPRTDDDAEVLAAAPDPELEYIRARYRGTFEAAFREALGSLPQRERTLLRLRYVEGLLPGRLARVYDVHRTTVMRWIDAAQAQLFVETRRVLRERLGVTEGECDSLLALVQSRAQVSLHALLTD